MTLHKCGTLSTLVYGNGLSALNMIIVLLENKTSCVVSHFPDKTIKISCCPFQKEREEYQKLIEDGTVAQWQR